MRKRSRYIFNAVNIFNNDVSKVIYHRSCRSKCQRITFAVTLRRQLNVVI